MSHPHSAELTNLSNTTPAVAIGVNGAEVHFGDVTALDGVSVDIHDNEFFTLLGPSGCGKTTLLRCIAGFESLNAGEISLFGENIGQLPPHQRPVNTVFQQYALFPLMTVLQNVMFGLQRLGQSDQQARERSLAMLQMVQLEDFSERYPAQLSGGQQQRVALARALAPKPKVLLLDEPLSALDLKLRQAVRLELKQLQKDTGITFVFVTHDQEEALTMSDRIAVMSAGRLQQIGTPLEIYQQPVNRFVASFIGETNLLAVTQVRTQDDQLICTLTGGAELLAAMQPQDSTQREFNTNSSSNTSQPRHQTQLEPSSIDSSAWSASQTPRYISIRPERLQLVPLGQGQLQGIIQDRVFLGTDISVSVKLDDGTLITVRSQNAGHFDLAPTGSPTGVAFDAASVRLLTE